MIIALEESKNKIFLKIVIKSFLSYCTFYDILRKHFIDKLMANFIPSAKKLDFDIEFILKHIMRSIEVIFELFYISNFEAKVTWKVVGFKFEGDFLYEFFLVNFYSHFKVQFINQLVGNVLFCRAIVEKLDEVLLVLDCHFLPGFNEVLLEQKVDSLKTVNLLTVLEPVPAIFSIFSHQVKPPTFTYDW